MAELREKHRVVANELDILRAESAKKDTGLVEKRAEAQRAVAARNALRGTLNRIGTEFRERHARADEQVAEIDKLNAIISSSEKDMLRLKRSYEVRASALAGSLDVL